MLKFIKHNCHERFVEILQTYIECIEANCDLRMAERCLRIALAADPDHAESLCNLGVLKMQESKMNEARSLFQAAILKGGHLYEAHFNFALLQHEVDAILCTMFSLKTQWDSPSKQIITFLKFLSSFSDIF